MNKATLSSLAAPLLTTPKAQRAWRLIMLLLICVISYLALTPMPPKQLDTGWDKVNHFLAFGNLVFAGYWAWPKARWTGLPLGLFLYGGAIEVIQSFVPGRSAEWGDLLADSIGIALGGLLAGWLGKLLRR